MKSALNNFTNRINKLFDTESDEEKRVSEYSDKVNKMYDTKEYNPFLKKNGELFNKFIDYQKILDNPNTRSKVKGYISKATGLTPTVQATTDTDIATINYGDYTENSGINGAYKVDSADGVFKNNELLNIIKRVSNETDVPLNFLLSVAQQETNGKWYDSVPDGTGKSYGYMMLYDNGVIADLKAKGKGDLAEKAKTDPYTNVLVGAQYLKQFYDQTGSWQQAATRYNGSGTAAENYGNKVWQRANSSAYINAAKNLSTASSNGTNSLVNTAKQYLGTPYAWGGTTPKGFDCSGLMQYTMAQNGVNIPRTSQAQFNSGQAISQSQLQPGDLVFFKSSSGTATAPGHVGMYVGNGQYIHAPQTGDVVKISNMSSRRDYVGARRYMR